MEMVKLTPQPFRPRVNSSQYTLKRKLSESQDHSGRCGPIICLLLFPKIGTPFDRMSSPLWLPANSLCSIHLW